MKNGAFVWLASRRETQETVVWGTGKAAGTYDNWNTAEPNGGNGVFCIEVAGGTHTNAGRRYKWDDNDCANVQFKSVVEF